MCRVRMTYWREANFFWMAMGGGLVDCMNFHRLLPENCGSHKRDGYSIWKLPAMTTWPNYYTIANLMWKLVMVPIVWCYSYYIPDFLLSFVSCWMTPSAPNFVLFLSFVLSIALFFCLFLVHSFFHVLWVSLGSRALYTLYFVFCHTFCMSLVF